MFDSAQLLDIGMNHSLKDKLDLFQLGSDSDVTPVTMSRGGIIGCLEAAFPHSVSLPLSSSPWPINPRLQQRIRRRKGEA